MPLAPLGPTFAQRAGAGAPPEEEEDQILQLLLSVLGQAGPISGAGLGSLFGPVGTAVGGAAGGVASSNLNFLRGLF